MKPASLPFLIAITSVMFAGCTSSVKSIRISNVDDAQRVGGLVYALPKSRIRLETSLEFVGCNCATSAYKEPGFASGQAAANSLIDRERDYVAACKGEDALYNIKELKLDLKPLPDPDAMFVLDVANAKQLTQTLDKLNIVLKEGLVESVDYTAEDHTANAIVETVRLKTALDGYVSAAPSDSTDTGDESGSAASTPASDIASQAEPVAINIYTAQQATDAKKITTTINEADGALPDLYRSGEKFRQACGSKLARMDFRYKEAVHTLKGYYDDRDAMYAKIFNSLDQPANASTGPKKQHKVGGNGGGENGSKAEGKVDTISKALTLWDKRVGDAHKFIAKTRNAMTFKRSIEWSIEGSQPCEPLINDISGVYVCVDVKGPATLATGPVAKLSDETESSQDYEDTGMYYRVPRISTVDVSLKVRGDNVNTDGLLAFHKHRFHNRAIYNEDSILARIPMTNGPFSKTEASFGFDDNGMINKYNYSSPKAPYNEAVKAAADAISARIVAKTPPDDASTSSDDDASSEADGSSSE